MPRGPAPGWRQRKQPVLDDYLLASIHQAGGKHHPETGHYAQLVIAGCASMDEAREYVRGLHRSGRYLVKYAIADIGINAKIRKNDGKFDVEFSAVDKAMARKHVIEKYGPDRSKWPYDPRRRGPQ